MPEHECPAIPVRHIFGMTANQGKNERKRYGIETTIFVNDDNVFNGELLPLNHPSHRRTLRSVVWTFGVGKALREFGTVYEDGEKGAENYSKWRELSANLMVALKPPMLTCWLEITDDLGVLVPGQRVEGSEKRVDASSAFYREPGVRSSTVGVSPRYRDSEERAVSGLTTSTNNRAERRSRKDDPLNMVGKQRIPYTPIRQILAEEVGSNARLTPRAPSISRSPSVVVGPWRTRAPQSYTNVGTMPASQATNPRISVSRQDLPIRPSIEASLPPRVPPLPTPIELQSRTGSDLSNSRRPQPKIPQKGREFSDNLLAEHARNRTNNVHLGKRIQGEHNQAEQEGSTRGRKRERPAGVRKEKGIGP